MVVKRKSQAHSKATPFLFFVLMGFIFWGRFIFSEQALFHDVLFRLFYPYANFFRQCLHAFQFPFWNPMIYSGLPFMANMQSAVFYPFTYLHLLFNYTSALPLFIWIHASLGGIFMFLLGRDLKLSAPAAFFAGLIFSCNGFFVSHYAFPVHLGAYIWTPLLVFLIRRFFLEKKGRYLVLTAIVLAVQFFAGHPQFVFYTALIVCVVCFIGHKKQKPLVPLLIAFGLALIVSLVQLVPALDLIRESSRAAHLGYDWATGTSVHPLELLIMLFGPLWNFYFTPTTGDPAIVGFYFGLPALFLSLMVLRGKKKEWIPYLVLIVLGVFLALGRFNPLYKILYTVFPPLQLFRFPAQAMAIVCFALPLLAAKGLDGFKLKTKTALLIIGFCALDFLVFSFNAVHTIDASFYKTSSATAATLKKIDPLGRVMMTPKTRAASNRGGMGGRTRLEAANQFHHTLFPNLGMVHGVYDVDGYEELRYEQYDRILSAMAADPNSPWFDILGVRFIISFWKNLPTKFKLIQSGPIYVYENPTAYPKAYFVSQANKKTQPVNVYKPGFIKLMVDVRSPGWLILTDAYDKGWRAHINGQPVKIHKVNEIQMAVPVKPGSVTVEFSYTPPWFFLLSLLSFGLLFAMIFLILKRPRKIFGVALSKKF